MSSQSKAILVVLCVQPTDRNSAAFQHNADGESPPPSSLAETLLKGEEAVFEVNMSPFLRPQELHMEPDEQEEIKRHSGLPNSTWKGLRIDRRGQLEPMPLSVICYWCLTSDETAIQAKSRLQKCPPWQSDSEKGFLWSHVIRIDDGDSVQEERIAVGYGASVFVTPSSPPEDITLLQVLFGYLSASEDWLWTALLSDQNEGNAQVLLGNAKALENSRPIDIEVFYQAQLVSGASAAILANLREKKYLYHDGLAKMTWTNARRAWHIDAIDAAVSHGIAGIKASTEEIARFDATRRDSRRNLFLLALSLITFAQTLLFLYDFLVTDDTTTGPVARVVLFAVVAVLATAIAMGVAIRLLKQLKPSQSNRGDAPESAASDQDRGG